MSGPGGLQDVLGLANAPFTPDCCCWSEDGVLAVAAGHSAVLVGPSALGGPRAFATPADAGDPTVLQAPGAPADASADAHHELAHLRAAALVSQYPAVQAGLAARALAWSPAGCGDAAGCLLAAVTSDHQVRWAEGVLWLRWGMGGPRLRCMPYPLGVCLGARRCRRCRCTG